MIAVDVNAEGATFLGPPQSVIGIILQSMLVVQKTVSAHQLQEADVVIKPRVGHIRWDELGRAEELITAGYEAGLESIEAIQKADRRGHRGWHEEVVSVRSPHTERFGKKASRHRPELNPLKGLHLILTRFQPGDVRCLLMFEPFQRFLILWAEGKPLKRFGKSDRPLITRLKPGENEMFSLLTKESRLYSLFIPNTQTDSH